MKTCIFLADGFEETEAVSIIDLLRRVKIKVDIISSYKNKLEITSKNNIIIKADKKINDIENYDSYDCFIIPGGLDGVINLEKNKDLKEIMIQANNNRKYLAAICAAPKALITWGILVDQKIVHYPNIFKYKNTINNKPVMIDKNIITGVSVGCSIMFGLLLVETLLGKKQKDILEESLLIIK